MSLTNDYFLLYHGITFQKNLEIEQVETKLDSNTFTIFALMISANRKNYEKFINLTSFKTLCQQLNIKTPSNANEFYHIQENVIELILSNRTKSNLEILSQSFEYLRNENIIDNDSYTKLNSLFDHKELESLKDDESAGLSKIDDDFKTSFKDLKHNIENICLHIIYNFLLLVSPCFLTFVIPINVPFALLSAPLQRVIDVASEVR